MNTTMIRHRLAETAKRVYRLQAERLERQREGTSLLGTEADCDRAGARTMRVEIDYLRALEAHFIDAEFALSEPAPRDNIVTLLTSISFTGVAADARIAIGAVHGVLRSIPRHGLARLVANYLLEEEQRLSNEQLRKAEADARFAR